MRRFGRAAMTAFVFVLAACGGEREAAREAVRQALVDPTSATFSAETEAFDKKGICGFVNAKNRMGGFSGPMPFLVTEGQPTLISRAPTRSDLAMLIPPLGPSWQDQRATIQQECNAIWALKNQCPAQFVASVETDPLVCQAFNRAKGDPYELRDMQERGEL